MHTFDVQGTCRSDILCVLILKLATHLTQNILLLASQIKVKAVMFIPAIIHQMFTGHQPVNLMFLRGISSWQRAANRKTKNQASFNPPAGLLNTQTGYPTHSSLSNFPWSLPPYSIDATRNPRSRLLVHLACSLTHSKLLKRGRGRYCYNSGSRLLGCSSFDLLSIGRMSPSAFSYQPQVDRHLSCILITIPFNSWNLRRLHTLFNFPTIFPPSLSSHDQYQESFFDLKQDLAL